MMVGDCSRVRQTSDAAKIAGVNEISKKRNMVLKNIMMAAKNSIGLNQGE